MENRKLIEVCFSPKLFSDVLVNKDHIVVIVDVFRATSSICTAFENGAKSIIPVAELADVESYKNQGYLIAGERNGVTIEGADFGNSPFNFSAANVAGKEIVLTTTNGTQAIEMAKKSGCSAIVIGSFLNLKALGNWLTEQNKDVVVLCAGWKNKFNLEDSLFAGALVDYLSDSIDFEFNRSCDSAMAAQDLWQIAKEDLVDYLDKSSHRHRLKQMVLDDVIEYCLTPNSTKVIPVYTDGKIVNVIG